MNLKNIQKFFLTSSHLLKMCYNYTVYVYDYDKFIRESK